MGDVALEPVPGHGLDGSDRRDRTLLPRHHQPRVDRRSLDESLRPHELQRHVIRPGSRWPSYQGRIACGSRLLRRGPIHRSDRWRPTRCRRGVLLSLPQGLTLHAHVRRQTDLFSIFQTI